MKKLISLVLTIILVLSVSIVAFADDTTPSKGYFSNSGLSKEEILEKKMERIDEMVKEGTLTEEKAAEYKKFIKERLETCEYPGQNRGTGKGMRLGFGRGKGTGRGLGRGPCCQ
ncbi:hypothetical protein [Anaeromicrobium sediminis]|uniref:DUF2680 domain-containing protein n=1 Tax=Anaeromicrobium sediminis TaxID=1478221 RepID=A0A267MCS8_9FIRM|nr:hypothetical protein [Anaeromicrobium sediminis]PAB56728.1 hypothetical protein CCE28_20480 [Anaeromicrobium sediminis]